MGVIVEKATPQQERQFKKDTAKYIESQKGKKKYICPDGKTEADNLADCPPKKPKKVGSGGIAEDIFG